MKKKQRVNRLVYIISGMIALVIVGIIVNLFYSKKEVEEFLKNTTAL